ncbi:uncharacterized protein IL334_000640 [Kwoniella shivajii]|uniref:Myb-like domain-containing protein n=1 Tax=Kwoniella shivajii TaxID=564305 RepID=A0ABZ1CTX4_9TREE|nr:hypothetical protein IL334_000640 [Kwoniella shivajii]
MPRQVTKTNPSSKPYNRSSSTEEIDIKLQLDQKETTKKPKTQRENIGNRKWTPDELIQLFEYVSKHGTSLGKNGWENAVPGRTANQSYQAWLQTLTPFIKKSIAGKA